MGYCTVDDLNALLTGFQINDASVPTKDQVMNEVIPRNDGIVNDRLAKYYVVPITGTKALVTINRIASWLAASDISDRVYMGESPSSSPQATTWRGLAEADLKRIVSGEIILDDAVPTSETPEKMSAQIKDYLSQPTYKTPPRFRTGMRF